MEKKSTIYTIAFSKLALQSCSHEMCYNIQHLSTFFTPFSQWVASSILCKFPEGFSLPRAVQVTADAEDEARAARRRGEAGPGASASSPFPEGAFDAVGRPHLLPRAWGKRREAAPLVPVPFPAGHGPRTEPSPLGRPARAPS